MSSSLVPAFASAYIIWSLESALQNCPVKVKISKTHIKPIRVVDAGANDCCTAQQYFL